LAGIKLSLSRCSENSRTFTSTIIRPSCICSRGFVISSTSQTLPPTLATIKICRLPPYHSGITRLAGERWASTHLRSRSAEFRQGYRLTLRWTSHAINQDKTSTSVSQPQLPLEKPTYPACSTFCTYPVSFSVSCWVNFLWLGMALYLYSLRRKRAQHISYDCWRNRVAILRLHTVQLYLGTVDNLHSVLIWARYCESLCKTLVASRQNRIYSLVSIHLGLPDVRWACVVTDFPHSRSLPTSSLAGPSLRIIQDIFRLHLHGASQ